MMIVLAIPVQASGPMPIAKVGKHCPSGYNKSGKYCIPRKDAKAAIEKEGKDCPRGTFKSGKYCKQY